ncbi:KamA family radical SAM protein [Thiospirochaeta perfilievii]|uniref:KamA family radical SAM protein n=1 Tax=Thiospirochaeta perfilievii TaxID=252967 RepID=A0A5C1QDQ2_9SPIO|nr:KamA family radical SAM protein [Thiospirochaeta perfilievii]QEN05711.1 KamA family radical SAM protein [Thiospirochaeta perfilievii]
MKSFRVTDYYKSISINKPQLEKQFTPDIREKDVLSYEVGDPLNEEEHIVAPRLVHRYKDRVLLLVTDNCRLYCRHCFRRDFIDRGDNDITDKEIDAACLYIKNNIDVHEVLISGGDPLTLGYKRLSYLLHSLKSARDNLVIRIGTRVPIVDPDFIDNGMLDLFKSISPVWMALQVNHPDELTPRVKEVLNKLTFSGVTLLNQAVLLKGVNDNLETLKQLCQKLLEFRVKPYYIFQGDLAKGTSHLRVPISKGLKLMASLRDEVSGIAMPTYAVDIPGGGGKIPLNPDFIESEDDNFYYLKNSAGFIGKYPKE